MDRELAERWADALDSGAYVQRQGALCTKRDDESKEYCCLGVLAELVDRLEKISDTTGPFDSTVTIFGIYDPDDERREFPNSGGYSRDMLAEVGMSLTDADTFVHLNDVRRYPFSKIAEEIRRMYVDGED